MPNTNFTAKGLAALKPAAVRIDYWDQSLPGFGLRVTPDGQKTWTVMYRFGGRKRRYTLGAYPALSLADARKLAREAQRSVGLGIDPAAAKKAERLADSFAKLAEQYLERYAKPRKKSWREDARIIASKLNPSFGNMRAQDVTRADVRMLLEKIAEHAPIEANRTLATCRKLYNWAISQDLVETNPCFQIPAPGQERQRDRVLSDDEVRTVWKDLENEEPRITAIMRLRLITAQRGGEVAAMERNELDLAGGWWTIPAEKAKNGLAHRVPLTAPAVKILERVLAAPDGSSYVFPAPLSNGKAPTSKFDLTKTTERIRKRTGIKDLTAHDLRRTAASRMTGMGIPRLTVSKILNHVEPGVTAVYDRHSYDREKREALETWALRLRVIVSGLREVGAEEVAP
jgi:integrase